MINTKKDRSGLYLRLTKLDRITQLKPLLEQHGYKLRIEDGKFVPRNVAAAYEVPWVYVKTVPDSRCDVYQVVFHQTLKHIHSFCRECYKVVVRPRTLAELFDLYELQKEMDVPSKCGLEHRDTTHGLYGGYFYCRGLEQGQRRYEQVKKAVNKQISKGVPVLLKRYCTEYEIGPDAMGPSNETPDATFEEMEMERQIESLFPRVGFLTPQSEHQIAYVMRRWIHHAYKWGDQTYSLFTDGSPLFDKYVIYNKE